MVIAGIGDNKVNHAKKIANTALGMLLLSKEVVSPLDEEPVQVWGSESEPQNSAKPRLRYIGLIALVSI